MRFPQNPLVDDVFDSPLGLRRYRTTEPGDVRKTRIDTKTHVRTFGPGISDHRDIMFLLTRRGYRVPAGFSVKNSPFYLDRRDHVFWFSSLDFRTSVLIF